MERERERPRFERWGQRLPATGRRVHEGFIEWNLGFKHHEGRAYGEQINKRWPMNWYRWNGGQKEKPYYQNRQQFIHRREDRMKQIYGTGVRKGT